MTPHIIASSALQSGCLIRVLCLTSASLEAFLVLSSTGHQLCFSDALRVSCLLRSSPRWESRKVAFSSGLAATGAPPSGCVTLSKDGVYAGPWAHGCRDLGTVKLSTLNSPDTGLGSAVAPPLLVHLHLAFSATPFSGYLNPSDSFS